MEIRRLTLLLNPPVLFMSVGILLRLLCSSCPAPCYCPAHDNTTLCKHRLLSIVPVEIPLSSSFLDLSYNRIRMVQHRAFSHLQDLQELDLSHNQLSRIEPGAFSDLPNLHILLVHHNQLKLLTPGVFSGMPYLTWLDVRANQLVILLDQTFRGLQELRHLEIGDNPFLFISSSAFLGMPLLQRLGLENTKLGSVPSQALFTLPRLSELRLGGVTSSVLRDLSFSEMTLLKVLDMDHWPSLANLGPLSLSGLNLSSLSLTQCNLSLVPAEALQSQIHLRRLDLSQNPITVLIGRCFSALKNLEELRLSGGKLLSAPSGSFNGLDNLRLLDLSNNPLCWVAEDALPPHGTLETLLLSGTNLSCDCRLCWVLHQKINLGGKPPLCAAPASLQGMVIPDNSQLLCPNLFTCHAPRIVEQGPRELKAKEGDKLTISCKSHGVPEPTTNWVLPPTPWTVDKKSVVEQDAAGMAATEFPQHAQIFSDRLTTATEAQTWRTPLVVKAVERGEGRITVLPEGSLQFLPVKAKDSGAYLCLASNVAGNDSAWVHLEVAPFNGTALLPSLPIVHSHLLIVISAGGILPFISSVTLCFIFIFLWSRGRGNIKHTVNIDYIPRTSRGQAAADDNKFTMKLL
ncbi:leucine-rich repeat and immunoglobulin-like domain-containing nogo receptor-interacting protein 4 [Pseudophryne corroboree]|uniref:leucine-rich repeat and immunoglobulin-like domain-containing nogo receptor-interacting protein 4 n=1 Tax=Pseudophryne corroboree TaxID=495146 RepID=UPI0030814E98